MTAAFSSHTIQLRGDLYGPMFQFECRWMDCILPSITLLLECWDHGSNNNDAV